MSTQRRVKVSKRPRAETCWFFIPPGGQETDPKAIIHIEGQTTSLHGETLNFLRVYTAKGEQHEDYREFSHPYTDKEFHQLVLDGRLIPVNREISWKQ